MADAGQQEETSSGTLSKRGFIRFLWLNLHPPKLSVFFAQPDVRRHQNLQETAETTDVEASCSEAENCP